MSNAKHDRLKQDLDELKLNHIAENYRELLDDAARKNTSALDVLIQLIGGQAATRRDRALARRVLIGPTGVGKSHFLTALGYCACEKGISVRFTRAIDMLNVLITAQLNGTLERKLREYVRPQLLLLDELGYLPIDKRGADLMFQVVAARYETGSIVLSTNRVFKEWGHIFDVDNTLATAMIERLMHHGEAIVIQGESYRTKDGPKE